MKDDSKLVKYLISKSTQFNKNEKDLKGYAGQQLTKCPVSLLSDP